MINVYRSSGTNSNLFLGDLHRIIAKRRTLIVGDFNICYLSDNSHPIFKSLREYGFHQLVEFPTHDKGRMIDLAFIYPKLEFNLWKSKQQSSFFSDHDIIKISSG